MTNDPVAPASFEGFCTVCDSLRATTSRLEKGRIANAYLQSLPRESVAIAARFLVGRTVPEPDPRTLRIGPASVAEALHGGQTTLHVGPLMLADIAQAFDQLANLTGVRSAVARQRILASLFARATPNERDWLLHLLSGEMRHGLNEGVLVEGLAKETKADEGILLRAKQLLGDIGETVRRLLEAGPGALRDVHIELFRPMGVMLADDAADVHDALARLGGRAAFEYKFDGARIVIHKRGDEVRVFSRRLSDVTATVPEAVDLGRRLRASDAVVEGEAVGCDPSGRPLPFQDLMRRYGRLNDRESVDHIGLRIFLFDVVRRDGRSLLDASNEERFRILAEIAPEDTLAPRIVTGDVALAKRFYDAALEAGHEGIVAKRLSSPYLPGRRESHWLKVKLVDTIDVVVIGAEWGTGRREGWLSNYHLGVRVPDEQRGLIAIPPQPAPGPVADVEGFAMVGKTFKGLTDDQFLWMTQELTNRATARRAWGVEVSPSLVVEVAFNGIQRSPHYDSGFALRFARIKRIRADKPASECTTLRELHARFARSPAPDAGVAAAPIGEQAHADSE